MFCRISSYYGIWLNISCNHTTRPYDGTIPNAYPGKNEYISPNPDIVTYDNITFCARMSFHHFRFIKHIIERIGCYPVCAMLTPQENGDAGRYRTETPYA